MSRFLGVCVLAMLVPVMARAGTADAILAADKAFSALSAAKGSNAAFLAFMADDARIVGTGSEALIAARQRR